MRWALTVGSGLILAGAASQPAPLPALLLLGLSVAGRHGVIGGLACGLLVGWWRPPAPLPQAGAPLTIVGRLDRPWRETDDGWTAELRVERYRQGRRVALWRERIVLSVPGGAWPGPQRQVRARGVLRRSPGLANVPPLPAGRWRLSLKSRRFLTVSDGGWSSLAGWRTSASRRRLESLLEAAGKRPGAALGRALVLGDATALPPAWRRGLRAGGLAHLMALSGLHVGLLAAGGLAAGAALRRGAGPAMAAAVVVGFLLLAGARPALLRASCMGILAAFGMALGRRPVAVPLLLLVAVVLAAGWPGMLEDVGFRLTCAATGGILLLAPRLEAAWPAVPRWLRRPLAMTWAAQLGSLPWGLPVFRLLTPLAPLWNLLLVPWTALALLGVMVWALLALIHPGAAQVALPALDLLAAPFSWLGSLPAEVLRPVPLVTSMWVAAVLAAAGYAALRWPRLGLPMVALVALVAWLWRAPVPRTLELRMFDVGQGEAILLRDGDAAVLVDGGGWRRGDLGGRVLLPAMAATGVRRLRAVVLTHPDIDHCRGLADLVSYLPVEEVWTAPGWRDSACASELIGDVGGELRLLWAGERRDVGRWRLRALHPEPGGRGRGNERSLVLQAAAPGMRVLLTGDIGVAAEHRLMRWAPQGALRSDVLKVAHHGSAGSSSRGFLAAVGARLALISCGVGNHYGHPAPAALGRLQDSKARLLRTDLSGEIVLRRVAGGGWRLSTPGAPRAS